MPPGKSKGKLRLKLSPCCTTAMPCLTFSGVSKFIRPHWSSGPKSPQVDPSGRLFHRFEEFMVWLCCCKRDCLLAKDALGARAESLQGLRALAASNPAAAKDYVAAIEAQRAEALSRHLAGIAPGLNATNDQVIDYMGR